ncbi:MAG: hypothetical protein KAX56_13090 [Phenylobacterium sp.]|nr:hypothetical protein [Phenylobacterium sp.]
MTREEAVQALVRCDRPLSVLRDSVAAFPFDWDGPPLATLLPKHLLSVLARWQRNEIGSSEVEGWANLIEVRDDLDRDAAVAEAIFDLANPALQGALKATGPRLIQQLRD